MGCPINSNPKHYKLVENLHGKLSGNSHVHQFLAVGQGIHSILPLDIQRDWGFIENQ